GNDLVYVFTGADREKTSTKRGTITAMTPNEVKLEINGTEQAFAVNEIKQLKFGDEPNSLDNARNAVGARNFNSALTELDKIDVGMLKRDMEKQEVAFLKAYCQAQQAMTEGGDKTAAANAMLDFVRATSKNHYRFYEAAQTLGDLMVASGKFDEAAKYYGETGLAGAPWPTYKLQANLALGRSQYLGGKFDDALKSYEAVIANELSTPETNLLKEFARAGKGACLAETGQPDEGIALIKKVILDNDPKEKRLFAYANNALGNCYLKTSHPKDALLAFLQTHLMFFGDGDTHAEALFQLARLGDSLERPEIASDARETLRQRFAGSHWLARQQ
ncbi:MAG: tetratricopeptide repeat protein, partial [Pirellulaceae bacterium]